VRKLLSFVGATIGGSVGWWIGNLNGLFTAFILSILGTAAGIYLANRFVADYF
jgi:hypothetical protein